MRIATLGAEQTAAEILAEVKRRQMQTVNVSTNMLHAFNDAGGNTPLASKPPLRAPSVATPGFMAEATGLLDKVAAFLSNRSAPAAYTVYSVKPAEPPYLAMAGLGVFAFILYKAVK